MKALPIFLILIFAVTISCKNEKPKTIKKETKITASVKHYICANKCENSGGDIAGNCPTCKTPYLHNQAWHNKDFLKNAPLNVPIFTGEQQTKNTPAPAQNKYGVYHYTCNNRCSGGAGTAAKCTTCGEVLAHNIAYHND